MFNSNHNFFKAIIFTSRKKSEKKHETFQRKRYLRIENTIKTKLC